MKIRIITAIVLGNVLMASHFSFAELDHGQVIDQAQAMADIAAKKAVDIGNKLCPVSGDVVAGSKMGDKPVFFEYNGKIYHLCCPMCIKDFKKNPEKFSAIADKEASTKK